MLKAKILTKKPKIEYKKRDKSVNRVMPSDIKKAIERLNLKYKKLDEIDVYNIYIYAKIEKKG